MRIVVTALTGTTEYVLCGGIADSEHIEAWDEGSEEMIQEAPFLRAVRRGYFARGNTGTTVRFQITKTHDDAQTCEEYMATAHRDVPKSGTIVFIAEADTGSQSRFTFTGGCIKSTGRTQIGVTSVLRYALVGGDFTEAI